MNPEFVFVAMRADGSVADVIPVIGGDWHEAECWAYLATRSATPVWGLVSVDPDYNERTTAKMAKQIISPADVLGKYKGRDVVRTTIAIHNAGDGLSDSMAIEPEVLDQGSTVYVVLECKVGQHSYVPIMDKGTDIGVDELKQVLKAGTATLIDAGVVSGMIEEQARKVRVARSEALEEAKKEKGELPLGDGMGIPAKAGAKKDAPSKVTPIKKAAAKRAAAARKAPPKS